MAVGVVGVVLGFVASGVCGFGFGDFLGFGGALGFGAL